MFSSLDDKTASVVYILLVLAGSVAVVLSERYQLLMFVPALGVLVMLLVVTREGYGRAGWLRLGLTRAGVKGWPLAFLAPLVALGGGYLVALAAGAAAYEPLFDGGSSVFLLNYLLLVVLYTFTFSLGEEFGWRGYLLPKLLSFGRLRGHLIGGLAWAAFHYPALFLTDLYLPEGNRLLNALLFTLMVVVLNIVFGELRLATGSLWVASLMHSAHNGLNELVGQGFTVTKPLGHYLLGEAGLTTIVLYGLIALLLVRHNEKPVESRLSV